ncbi:SCO7613 C-terminal domain-containing membrane protein [Salinibacterium sp. PAMC 21357]|uniref:SCO7613 C-terminal domain-containing membrane protein n=1 Tax=Salinibacterium sp. PAMC 21357 TaxID=1112215 RepID=UPI000287BC06|nr:hypothetical protein [Salinibacterium sp. PAMC 21357]
MVDAPRSFLEHVGHVLFPRGPKDLTDVARCPACFVTVPPSFICAGCGFDLNHSDAILLREESLAAAASLDRRLELIGKIRFETEAERTRIFVEQSKAAEAAAAAIATTATRAIAAERALREADAERRATAATRRAAEATAVNMFSPSSLSASSSSTTVHLSTAATEHSPANQSNLVAPAPHIAQTPHSATTAQQSQADGTLPPPNSATALAPPARSHVGIQVILLIVGVSLLSVGAIFFLIYAFISFGLIWRSAIIATITIASIVGATVVKKRGLSATAEALSALAVVLVALDIYAVRANDLLVIGDLAGRAYWGAALMLASIGFIFWHRASRIALVNIIGYVVFPPAVALFVAGLAAGSSLETTLVVPMVALSLAALIYLTASHDNYPGRAERGITLGYAMLALTLGFTSSFFDLIEGTNSSTAGWVLILGATAAIHSAAAYRAGFTRFIRKLFATTAGVLVAWALWNLVADAISGQRLVGAPAITVFAVVATLTTLAVLTESSGLKFSRDVRTATFWASLGVWAVAAIALIAPFATSLTVALEYVSAWPLRRTTPGNIAFDTVDNGWPQVALLCVPVILALGWWATGQLRPRTHLVLALAGAALALSAPLAGTLFAAVATWLALSAAAVAIIGIGRRHQASRASHLIIAAGGAITLALAYTSGRSSHETWLLASIATGVVLFVARYLVNAPAVRATMLGIATLIFIVAAGGIGEQLQFNLTTANPNPLESWITVAIISVIIIARSLWPHTRELADGERRMLWWIGFLTTALSGASLWIATAGGAPLPTAPLALNLSLISLIVGAIFVTALSVTMFNLGTRLVPREKGSALEKLVAAVVIAPATVWTLDSASRVIGLGEIAIQLAPATASILVATLSMTLRVRQQHPLIRRTAELSALTVAAITTTSAILQPHQTHWLIALLVSITLLLASISADGIFGSQSPRRHIIWAAVTFATWALWLRLDQNHVDALEAYVLPLAATILTIAIFTARAEAREPRMKSAPVIVLVGLLIAILPLALNSASGTELRSLVIAGLSAALLLIASFAELRGHFTRFRGVTIVASALGVVTAIASRGVTIVLENRSATIELDLWLLGAVAILVLASFGLAAAEFPSESDNARWSITNEVLLGAAIVLLYSVETVVLVAATMRDVPLDSIRAITLVALGGLLLIAGNWQRDTPFTPRLSHLSSGLAIIVGVLALIGFVVHPIEWITVIFGTALIVHGSVRLAHNAEARSLTWLTPGLLVVLVPSLVATFINTGSLNTQWRIVALGIVCVLIIVAGAWQKLKAPLLIATIVVLIHAVHTFAPALVSLYQLTVWWMWAVIGGAIVLFLGITLERRIRDLKTLNTRFSALR